MKTSKFSAILLAAGESERLGQNKLLLPLRHKTVLENVIDKFESDDILEILIVVGKFASAFKKNIHVEKVKWVLNPDPSKGMSSSIKIGLQQAASDSAAVFITPADMPVFKKETVTAMINAFERGAVIVPTFQRHRGHPVLLDKKIADECLSCTSERILYQVLRDHRKDIRWLAVEDEGILQDMDTIEDYEKIKSSRQ